jgi:predicted membrane protein
MDEAVIRAQALSVFDRERGRGRIALQHGDGSVDRTDDIVVAGANIPTIILTVLLRYIGEMVRLMTTMTGVVTAIVPVALGVVLHSCSFLGRLKSSA